MLLVEIFEIRTYVPHFQTHYILNVTKTVLQCLPFEIYETVDCIVLCQTVQPQEIGIRWSDHSQYIFATMQCLLLNTIAFLNK